MTRQSIRSKRTLRSAVSRLSCRRLPLAFLLVFFVGSALALDGAPSEESQKTDDYLALVRTYADTMIEKGRDHYGTTNSPLFAAALDLPSLTLPTQAPPNVLGARGIERSWRGANPMHDRDLYPTLYVLTKATGEKRYAEASDTALKWFFENCQSATTGLMAWGEHLQWDFIAERSMNAENKKWWEVQEFCGPWLLWDRCFDLAPEASRRLAIGLWEHHIDDKQAGTFSRHGFYAKHKPESGWEFPRHGGFFIAGWAKAYEHSKDPEFVRAVNVLVDGFLARRDPTTGCIPATARWKTTWPLSNLSLAIDLWETAPQFPADTAKKMKDCATQIDEVFLKIRHDLSLGGKGFIANVDIATLAPATVPDAWSQTWSDVYAEASMALVCEQRYRQTKQDGYRRLVLAAAQRYLKSDPPDEGAVQPGTLASAMRLMRVVHEMTGDAVYKDRAVHFAELARRLFLKDSPLPRAKSGAQHYEALSGANTLMMEYLAMWCANNKPELLKELESSAR